MRVRFLGWEDRLEKMTTHPSILALKIPWPEEPCWLQTGVTKSQTGLSMYSPALVSTLTRAASLPSALSLCGLYLSVLKYVFIWLLRVLVVAHRIFHWDADSLVVVHQLSCPSAPGIFKDQNLTHAPCFGRWILNHLTTSPGKPPCEP